MSEQNAIDLRGVSLSLQGNAGKIEILHNIDLRITQGSSCALVGPSGSGKSSLLMLMAGLEKPSTGTVSVSGRDISSLSERSLAEFRRGKVGVVFQSFHLLPSMTAIQNVATALELANDPSPLENAKKKLTDVGLSHRLDHFPKQLSGGEQQRVGIARALAPNPKIVFADEPTGNLDATNGAAVADLLFTLTKQQLETTLILVTHDLELAKRCDRVVNISDGKISEELMS
ncbi:MAG: ABC transporter ATP-binding protein [Planktomarina sp.]|nr:ABC transporter ATP-binding protein [Planktomarina sp.]MDT2018612.1 ABC transporter ATP-binding protein [Planktomarina sp.]